MYAVEGGNKTGQLFNAYTVPTLNEQFRFKWWDITTRIGSPYLVRAPDTSSILNLNCKRRDLGLLLRAWKPWGAERLLYSAVTCSQTCCASHCSPHPIQGETAPHTQWHPASKLRRNYFRHMLHITISPHHETVIHWKAKQKYINWSFNILTKSNWKKVAAMQQQQRSNHQKKNLKHIRNSNSLL